MPLQDTDPTPSFGGFGLSMIWLSYYIFTMMGNNMLGIASLGATVIGFILTLQAIKEDK